MTSRSPTLELRTPNTTWMLVGIFATLVLFGILWFVFSGIINLDQPSSQSQIIMISGLGWMVFTVVWWKMKTPQSRLHAVFTVLLSTLAVALAGTTVHFIGLLFKGVLFDRREMVGFTLMSIILLVAQLILAVPSAILMQQLVLRRARPSVDLPA